MSLDLPVIDPEALAPAAPTPAAVVVTQPSGELELEKVDLTEVALAKFGNWREQISRAEKALKNVVHDLSTSTKITEAKSLRFRLIGQPLADARKVSAALKSKLTAVSKDVGEHLEEIVTEFNRVEQFITPQIEAREKELREEKEREDARKAKHTAAIARIAGYVAQAAGVPSNRIAAGIEFVSGIDTSAFEEFAAEAEATKARTVAALRTMLTRAEAAENEALLSSITRTVAACLGKPAPIISEHLQTLRQTVYSEGVGPEVLTAHEGAIGQLSVMLQIAQQAEAAAAIQDPPAAPAADGSQDSDGGGNDIAPAKAGQDATPESEGNAPLAAEHSNDTQAATVSGYVGETGPAAHAEERAAVPGSGDLEAGIYFPSSVVSRRAIVVRQRGSIETSEADARPATDAEVQAAIRGAAVSDEISIVLKDTAALLKLIGEAFEGKFPSHPKPAPEWWARVRQLRDSLTPRVAYTLTIPRGEA